MLHISIAALAYSYPTSQRYLSSYSLCIRLRLGGEPVLDFNYFQSNARIEIECAFGLLSSRWRILRHAFSNKISIRRTIALVQCLCRLHNFCIDNGSELPPDVEERDNALQTGIDPNDLLGGGQHYNDVDRGASGARARERSVRAHQPWQREAMLRWIIERRLFRPMVT